MKIGISSWGFINPSNGIDTPDGGRSHRRFWLRRLLEREENNKKANEVWWMQEDRDRKEFPNENGSGVYPDWAGNLITNLGEFPELDVVLFEWRWPIPTDCRNCLNMDEVKKWRAGDQLGYSLGACDQDLRRQWELIHHYGKAGAKLIFWDKDMKLTPEDLLACRDYNFEICVSAIDHVLVKKEMNMSGVRFNQLFTPLDFKELANRDHEFAGLKGNWNRSHRLGYVGNNYERDTQFNKYILPAAQTFNNQIHVWGNWLKYRTADVLSDVYPNVKFHERINFAKAEEIMQGFGSTIILSKDNYSKVGFCAARITEAIWNHIPMFIPKEFEYSEQLCQNTGDVGELIKFIESIENSEMKLMYSIYQKKYFMDMNQDNTFNLDVWEKKFYKMAKS